MSGALIVTAMLAPEDHAPLDALRRAHFPAGRNHLPAHLTLFHALPPSAEGEVWSLLSTLAARPPIEAMLGEPYSLGGGVAYRVRSDALERLRSEIAERFHGMLTAQDSAGWRAHITVQNKVDPAKAERLLGMLREEFRPRALRIVGLALDRYAGGPWEGVARFPFRR